VKLIRGFVEDVFRSTVEFCFLFVLSGFGVVVRSDHLMVRWRFGARKLLVQVTIGNDTPQQRTLAYTHVHFGVAFHPPV